MTRILASDQRDGGEGGERGADGRRTGEGEGSGCRNFFFVFFEATLKTGLAKVRRSSALAA